VSDWFKVDEESLRLLSEERLVVAATELVSEALELRGVTRSGLAARLGTTKSEVTQRLSGRRNLTLRSFAAMLHELGYEARLQLRDCRAAHGGDVVYRGARQVDWPKPNMSYSSQRQTPLRVIKGGQAA